MSWLSDKMWALSNKKCTFVLVSNFLAVLFSVLLKSYRKGHFLIKKAS